MTTKFFLPFGFLFFAITFSNAQELPSANLNGKNLREWLKENWYDGYHWTDTNDRFNNPAYADLYRNARREMYNFIDNQDNKLTDVYGGLTIDFEAGTTSTDVYPLNCEHTVPQSFFRPVGEDNSSEPMRSDIHHLFPTFDAWNSTRSNYPFDEIEDSRATKWMIEDNSFTVTPTSDIELYSEFSNLEFNRFEPREDHKGNVARAILYFYTMYEDNELVLRPIDHVADINLLIDWHKADPVDQAEKDRDIAIANYQGNQNPYVVHPELVTQAWSVVTSISKMNETSFILFPNPATDQITLSKNPFSTSNSFHIRITDLSGHIVRYNSISVASSTLDISDLNPGMYLLYLSDKNTIQQFKFKKVD